MGVPMIQHVLRNACAETHGEDHGRNARMIRGLQFTILGSLLVAAVQGLGMAAAAEPAKDELMCGREPGNRFYWVERAFCDLSVNGPEKAHGVIIWNHGISGTTEQWRYPVPPAFRLLQTCGWDVIAIKRHNQGDAIANPLERAVQRTLEEAKHQLPRRDRPGRASRRTEPVKIRGMCVSYLSPTT